MKKIGEGMAAETFVLESNEILKLFYHYEGVQEWVAREIKRHRLVEKTDLPVPRIKKTVQIDDRPGIVFEQIGEGKSLLETVWSRPLFFFRSARLFGELLAKIHSQKVSELPSQREAMVKQIENATELSAMLREAALDALRELPDGEQLCHGDFYLSNVIVELKRVNIIDWSEATRGNPLADVACTSLGLRLKGLPRNRVEGWMRNILRSSFNNTMLRRYQEFHSVELEQIREWELPVAVYIGVNPWGRPHNRKELFAFAERRIRNEGT